MLQNCSARSANALPSLCIWQGATDFLALYRNFQNRKEGETVADGRQHIEDTTAIIEEVSARLGDLKDGYSADQLAELEMYLESAQKWVKLCRRKVWLRGQEGTAMAQGCLDSANQLQAAMKEPDDAIEAVAELSYKLESLARVLSTKSQVLT